MGRRCGLLEVLSSGAWLQPRGPFCLFVPPVLACSSMAVEAPDADGARAGAPAAAAAPPLPGQVEAEENPKEILRET